MPNRFIKEAICRSETVDLLTAEEERLFVRLITKCDDFGCFDARPAIIRAECFPLKVDTIDAATVAAWTLALARAGLILLYADHGHPYLQMATWRKHQQTRATKPKYPLPDDCERISLDNPRNPLLASDSNGKPMCSYSYSYPDPDPDPDVSAVPSGTASTHPPDGRMRLTPAQEGETKPKTISQQMWDAFLEAGIPEPLTKSERGRMNHAIKQLLDAGETPSTLPTLCDLYRERWGDVDLTPNALAANLGQIKSPAPSKTNGHANGHAFPLMTEERMAAKRKADADWQAANVGRIV